MSPRMLARCAALAFLVVPAAAAAQDAPSEDEAPVTPQAEVEGIEAAPIEAEPIEDGPIEDEPIEDEVDAQEPPPEPNEPQELARDSVAAGRMADGSLDPCATDLRSRPIGPLSVGALDGHLGVPLRACPRHEVALGGDALLVADTANFYGNIRAGARVRLSALLDPNVEGFVSWEAFRFHNVISSLNSHYIGLGYLSYGAIARVLAEDGRVLAVTGRMVLPTTTGLDQSTQPLALDVGLSGAWQADTNFRFHMWLTLLGSIGIGAGPALPRGGVRVGGGVDWRPFEWLSFVLEVQSGFGYAQALDLLAAQAGVRLALGTEVGLEIAASMPFLGERAFDSGALPLAASLTLSWHVR